MHSPVSQHSQWFAKEVLPHAEALRGFLKARFPSLEDLDDLIQESFVRLLRVHSAGPVACPKAYLFVTARNLALNQLRRSRFEAPEASLEGGFVEYIDKGADTHGTVERNEQLALLCQAIEALPERCRQVMTLRKIYGLSQQEVARQLGISENTVETQSVIGLRKCTEFFRRHGMTPAK